MSAAHGLAVGVDVAARRGCDVVMLDAALVAHPVGRVHTADELRALLERLAPAVVAIDAPPGWASPGRARACERALAAHTLAEINRVAAAHPTLETFPHAVAIALRGGPPEHGLLKHPAAKKAWRRAALDAAGVDHSALRTIDEIDAALCAITGRRFLEGRTVELGDPAEGVLTVPVGLPERRAPRGSTTRTR